VLNAVVLWNTRYIDAAVAALRSSGYPVADEDAARLSPLGDKHINIYLDMLRTRYVAPVWAAIRIFLMATDSLAREVGASGS
jgi:uncharacterized protein (DUF2461 family)